MTERSLPDLTVSIPVDAAFIIKRGCNWWPPTRNRYVSNMLNSFNPEFAWTDKGLEYKVLRHRLVPYQQVSKVSLFELKRLVQRGSVVSSSRTGMVVTFESSESQLLVVPLTASLLRLALEQARLRGCVLDAEALSLLAS